MIHLKSFFKRLSLPSVMVGILVGTVAAVVGTTGVRANIAGSTIFTDVPGGSYFDTAVGNLFNKGIINGRTSTTFAPGEVVTRADLAVILDRLMKQLEAQEITFSRKAADTPSPSATPRRTRKQPSEQVSSEPAVQPPAPPDSGSASQSQPSTAAPASPVTVTAKTVSAKNKAAGSLHFSIDKMSATERTPQVKVSVFRTGGSEGEVTVAYRIAEGTATKGKDFSDRTGSLRFTEGKTSEVISISILDDKEVEQAETFTILLENPTGGAGISDFASVTISILDNDQGSDTAVANTSPQQKQTDTAVLNPGSAAGGVIAMAATDYTVTEKASSATLTILRSGNTSAAVAVNYKTTGVTATSGKHFTSLTGTLNFGAGETSKTVSVILSDNGDLEGNKYFTFDLEGPTAGAVLGSPASAKVVVVDDEMSSYSFTKGAFRLRSDVYEAYESRGYIAVIIERFGGADGSATVSYITSNGTASGGADFESRSGTLTFGPGESAKQIIIPILTDTVSDANETFTFTISNATDGTSVTPPQTTTITIHES